MGLLSTIGAASGRAFGFTRSAIAVATDAFFNRVTLLLPGNGTNGAQNNTFLDSSSNNFTITRNGNTTQGTFSPFSQTGWSTYLNGSSSFTAPAGLQTAFAGWGGRTRTWECWIHRDSTASYNLQSAYAASAINGRWYISISASNKLIFGWTTSTSTQTEVASVASVPAGWVHLSVTVNSTTASSTTIYLGINGIVETFTGNDLSTQTSTAGWNDIFGSAIYLPAAFTGYATGLRWSSNLRYTSNYTVPTALFANDGNTLFLFGQQNRFSDQSGNAYSIAVGSGAPSVQAFSPFAPAAAYSAATVGGSGYFDGSGDNIQTAGANANLSIGTGDFTLECWAYLLTTTGDPGIMQLGPSPFGTNTPGYSTSVGVLVGTASGKWAFIRGGAYATSTINAVVGQWTHLALCRSGSTHRFFVNGVLADSATDSSNYTTQYFAAGCAYGTNFPSNAYISNVRLLRGTALYTSAFTPPTAPVTAITNTHLLLNFTNAGITDATAKNVLETVGNAQISTAQSRFGGGSIYMDGAGDNLVVGPNPLFNFGSSDFTIEFWIYPASFAALQYPLFSTSARSKADVIAFELTTAGNLGLYITASGGGAWSLVSGTIGALTLNTWTHIALVRSGSSIKAYVNGTLGSINVTSSTAVAAFDGWNIGTNGAGSGYFNGYLDDLRISRYARYTANFTPPTVAFALQ